MPAELLSAANSAPPEDANSYRPASVDWSVSKGNSPTTVSDLQLRLKSQQTLARATGLGPDGIFRERILMKIDGRYPNVLLNREFREVGVGAVGTPSHEYAFVADHLLVKIDKDKEGAVKNHLAHLGWSEVELISGDDLYRLPLKGDALHAVDKALATIQADPILSPLTVEPDFLVTTSDVIDSTLESITDENGHPIIDPITQDWMRLPTSGPETQATYGADALIDQAGQILAQAPPEARLLQFEIPKSPESFRPGILQQNFWTRSKSSSDTSSVFIQGAYTSGSPLNGSNYVRILAGDEGLVISHKDGLPFQVHQIDLSEYSTTFATRKSVTFRGYRLDGTSVSQSFGLDGQIDGTGPLADFQTFHFPDTFKNLIRLEAESPPYMLDNLVVTLDGNETPMPPDPPAPVVYDVDWNDTNSMVGQKPPVGGPYGISSISNGSPIVRQSLGALTDQPLDLVGGGSTGYSQIRFDLLRNSESYVVEFDMLKVNQSKPLTLFFDCVSGIVRVDFGVSTITVLNSSGSYVYNSAAINKVRAAYSPLTSRLELSLNNIPVFSKVPSSVTGDVRSVRISVTDTSNTGGVGIDNLKIEAYAPENPPLSAPRLALFPQTLLTFPNTVVGGSMIRSVTLKNAGTADLRVSSITSDNAAFVPNQSVIPVIPPGGTYYSEISFRPTMAGQQTGKLRITSNAEEGEAIELNVGGIGLGVPTASLSPTLLNASIVTGTRGTQGFEIINTGEASLTWRLISIAKEGQNPPLELHTDDPLSNMLWGLGSASNSGIDARRAWTITEGSPSVVVAVIDTGVETTHPDLAGNMAVNSTEIPGNGIDDDGNGFIDDVHGWDFVLNSAGGTDPHGHGTHVAGTIAAQGDNAYGVVGVAWRSQILPIRFLSASGVGYTSDAIKAVDYARTRGARLINASWGGGGSSALLLNAIALHIQETAGLFVAAAGNSGTNNDAQSYYPASYPLSGVVSVAASSQDDRLASFSNHGKQSVDIAAPGVQILSTHRSSGFAYMSGTSMAAPHVSGALALLNAQNPSLKGDDYRALLLGSADFPGALNGWVATDGRVNAWRALNQTANSWLIPEKSEGVSPPMSTTAISLEIDATALSPGDYESILAFQTNDPLRSNITLPVHLEVESATSYRNWARETFADNGLLHADSMGVWADDADPDWDGVPNLVEFVLGRSATSADRIIPLEVLHDEDGLPYVTFEVAPLLQGVAWTVEASSSLISDSWTDTNLEIVEISSDPETGKRRFIAKLKNHITIPSQIFFRIRAIIND